MFSRPTVGAGGSGVGCFDCFLFRSPWGISLGVCNWPGWGLCIFGLSSVSLYRGEGQQLLQNNCCFGTWHQGQIRNWLGSFGQAPQPPSCSCLRWGWSCNLGNSGAFQWDDQTQLWDEVWNRVGAHWPVLTAASDVMFPALCLANSYMFSIMGLPSYPFQDTSLERPFSLLSLLCDNFILPLSHLSKMRPSFYIRNKMLNSLLYFAKLVCPNQARAEFCSVWGSVESRDGGTFRSRRFWERLTPSCGHVALGVIDHLTFRVWVGTKLSLTNWDERQTRFAVTCSCCGTTAEGWPVFLSQIWRIGTFYSPKLLQRTGGSLRSCVIIITAWLVSVQCQAHGKQSLDTSQRTMTVAPSVTSESLCFYLFSVPCDKVYLR